MNDFELYKDFYFRELDRRQELNEAVNTPILILTAVVSIQVFAYSQNIEYDLCLFQVMIVVSGISVLAILYSLYYLLISFFNVWRIHGYGYDFIADMAKQRNYLNELRVDNEADASTKWEAHLKNALADCSSKNFEINNARSEALALAKRGVVAAIFFTIVFSFLFIISLINYYGKATI